MALVKNGSLVSAVSGKIGGTVFTSNGRVRTWAKPTTSTTERASLAKARLASVVNAWQSTLTDAQRESWNSLASSSTLKNRLGESIKPSGSNLFTKVNTLLLQCGGSIVTAAPADVVIAGITFTMTGDDTDGVEITALSPALPATATYLLVQKKLNLRQSIYSFGSGYDDTEVVAVSALGTLPYTLDASADVTASTRAFYRFRLVGATGVVSAPWHQTVDISA